jgi:hypothetical protein
LNCGFELRSYRKSDPSYHIDVNNVLGIHMLIADY